MKLNLISPDQFITLPAPGYSEIRLAVAPRFGVRKTLRRYRPDIVHIVTEGPIGWAARSWCIANVRAFHQRLPYPLSGLCSCPDRAISSVLADHATLSQAV